MSGGQRKPPFSGNNSPTLQSQHSSQFNRKGQSPQYGSFQSQSSMSNLGIGITMSGVGSGSSTNTGANEPSQPQKGSFTQNYELYSMNKIFCINTSKDSTTSSSSTSSSSHGGLNNSSNITSSSSGNNSNTFINSSRDSLTRSSSQHKSLSEQMKDINQKAQGGSGGVAQQQPSEGVSTIILLAQAASEDHTFTAMYCSNDFLIFRYVGQSKVPFYKCLIWDKDPTKRIVSMTFDPFAKWLFCLLSDTSCKIISIYYTMCKKVTVNDTITGTNNNNNNTTKIAEKSSEKLSSWMSTSRLLKSTLSNTDVKKGSTGASTTSSTPSYFSVIPPLNKKGELIGSSCIWWKTSNGVDYGIVSTTSGHIYFILLSDKEVHRKFKFPYPITKIELVNQSSETYLLIFTKTNGYFQLMIEQKLDSYKFENIVSVAMGSVNQKSGTKNNINSNTSMPLFINNSATQALIQQHHQLGQLSLFQIVTPLFQSDRNQADRDLCNQESQDNSDTVIASFIKSTSKLEIYEPLYLNKYPIFIYQLPPNTTHFYFTKNITIISEYTLSNPSNAASASTPQNGATTGSTGLNGSNGSLQNGMQTQLGTFFPIDVCDRMNVSILSNLVAGTASNSKYMNNQSIMQTFTLGPGETVLGITKSLKDRVNHHRQDHHFTVADPENSEDKDLLDGESRQSSTQLSSLQRSNSNVNVNQVISNLRYTILPTCFVWTNLAIYELRPKKSPEEIFFELVSKNLEKSDGEALGKTFRMDLLSLYETAADLSFEMGQYGRALDLYYLSGVKTNKLVFKFLEIGRMDIIMTHLKAILHQSETFNVLDRKKISDILFQCYLQKLLSNKEEFKSVDSEFSNFLSTNQDYAVVNALQMLSSNGLLEYFFEVAHARKMVDLALNMLFESDILHLDAHNISFLQSGYSQELKSHSNGLIFDCLPPNIQAKLIIEDPQNILLYFRRLYPILSYLDIKDLLMIAETFDPLLFIEPKNSSYTTSIQLTNDSHDSIFEQNFLPSRQSESIQVKNEEYFELYILTLLELIYKKNQQNATPNISSTPPLQIESESNSNSNANDKNDKVDSSTSPSSEGDKTASPTSQSSNNVDQELLVHPMTALSKLEIKCVKVSCGWDHVGVLTENGDLYTWGSNKSDQLGHGLEIGKFQTSPKRVEYFSKLKSQVIMIECGGEHTVAVDVRHHVYSWGYAKYGQLGHGKGKITENKPKKIEDLSGGQRIKALACGYAHTLILKFSGDLYAFGFNEYGQLGLGNFQSTSLPTRMDTSEIVSGIHQGSKINQIGCGYAHSVLCTDMGDVYSWGIGNYLGLGINENISRPKQIESLRGVIDISCGHYHTVATTDLKNIYSWGQGEHMKLGHGSNRDEPVPRNIEFFINKNVRKIKCGLNFSIAYTKEDLLTHKSSIQQQNNEDDVVYIWGGGEHGKLGLGGDPKSPFFDKPIPTVIKSINALNVMDLDCGSEFTAMITQNGGLYLWGHGKLGQIGNGKSEDQWVPTRVPLYESNRSTLSSLQTDNKKQRYTQEGLEEILRSHPNAYRPYHIISKAQQFQNWEIVAVIYDILKDYRSTLECKLIALEIQNHEPEKEVGLLLQLLHQFIITNSMIPGCITIQQQHQLQQQQQLILNNNNTSASTPPMISTQTSTPLTVSPLSRSSSSDIKDPNSKSPVNTSGQIKEQLLIMLLKYYHKKSLPVQDMENYLLQKMDSYSLLLSNIIQINVNLELPLILDFSSTFYLTIIKNYLQQMKDQSDQERQLQKVSEKILWTNIRENLEKDLLLRSKIEIPSLPTMMDSHSYGNSSIPNEKDIAFTCNHFFSKRSFFGQILPDFQNEIQKLSLLSSDTIKFILDEYNQRSISIACPQCLLHSLRDLKYDDVSKNNIIKLFKLS
ncbi:regulator of chromosome condensation domain-containing protein [Tieghemostelium lacteum]|uniref:Regulator of chromosome condensation domain-containing protein n=1 Tax=Tieghemostelium lacteum TaxID=361077 RepID=A0A151Z4U1_TIELA|nr:regulator of chromosome condensation domain-containing protein [Tieghemostelium lacteum]|eukprot:KYQ88989.1 regulator of chromosome condensation domain-containing protein [Tieghemostelium lacteum]